jgi:hypothetical protein
LLFCSFNAFVSASDFAAATASSNSLLALSVKVFSNSAFSVCDLALYSWSNFLYWAICSSSCVREACSCGFFRIWAFWSALIFRAATSSSRVVPGFSARILSTLEAFVYNCAVSTGAPRSSCVDSGTHNLLVDISDVPCKC